MALDPKFFISPNLQENFTDKDSGCPLVNGTITFFEDEARTTPKNVFVLSGTVPAYTYTDIGNVVTLNNAGATSYDPGSGATDVRLYYFPFDADGNPQLYFAEVRSADSILQLTREAWPNITASSTPGNNGDSAFTNYIPNGQFLSHNDLVDDGLIVAPITQIGYGNWTFERPGGSGAVDNVTFVRFASYITNPEAHPRYAVRVVNTGGGGGDGSKDIRVKFDDVNKFGSDNQNFTFKFQGKSTSGNFDVDLVLIKNYGTGGSSTTETSLGTFTITGAYQSFSTSFVFGDNATKTIGPDDDDFLQLAIRLPIGVVFEGEFTDYAQIEGDFSDVVFPDTTTRQSVSQFIGGASEIPDYEGRDLYLTERLTPTGKEWDHSQIGKVFVQSTPALEIGELFANGDAFLTADYSADGIPFRRLQEKYFDPIELSPIYGTGDDYATSYFIGLSVSATSVLLTANSFGSANAIADGATSTGFTFVTSHTGIGSSSFDVNTFLTTSGQSWMQNESVGLTTPPSSGTSTVIVGNVYDIEGTVNTPQEFNVVFPLGSTLGNGAGVGLFWRYFAVGTDYYVWYSTGAETDPSVGGATGIQVNISLTDDIDSVANKTVAAISNFESSSISIIAAGGMTAGAYFTFGVPSEDFYVWYTIDGAGTDPLVTAHTEIQVDILSADDANAVVFKTQTAINSRKFAVPDYREQFLRGTNMGRAEIGLDGSIPFRFNRKNFKFGADNVGSEELSLVRMHKHPATSSSVDVGDEVASGQLTIVSPGNIITTNSNATILSSFPITTTVLDSEFQESRPANAYVNYVIKY